MKGYNTMRGNCMTLFLIAIREFGTCYCQQKPSYTIPNFSRQSVGQDFCTVHRLVEEGKIERRDALRGMEIRPVLFSYQLNPETGAIDEKKPGAEVDFLDELAKRAGFSWRDSYGVAEVPQGNQTWTDVISWGGTAYDLVGDYCYRTEERVELGMLFSEPWIDTSTIMVSKKDVEKKPNFFNFLTPFTYGLWGLICITLFATGFVYYLLDFFDSRRHGTEMNHDLRQSIFNAAWTFTGHTLAEPTSSATRVVVFSLSFLCLLIVSAYTANLVTFLVAKRDGNKINGINDVIRYDLSCCVDKTSNTFQRMKKDYPTVKLVPIEDPSWGHEDYHALQRSECDVLLSDLYIFETRRRSSEYNPNCNLEWVGKKFDDRDGSFALKDSLTLCSSIVGEVLSIHLLEMKRDNTFYEIWENFYARSDTVSCQATKETNEDSQRLGITHMYGIFAIHFALLVAAIIWSFGLFGCKFRCSKTKEAIRDVTSCFRRNQSLSQVPSVAPDVRVNINSQITSQAGTDTEFVQENQLSDRPRTDLLASDQIPCRLEACEENIGQKVQKIWEKLSEMETKKESKNGLKEHNQIFEENLDKQLEDLQKNINEIEEKQLGTRELFDRDRQSRKSLSHLNTSMETQRMYLNKLVERQNQQFNELYKKINEIEKKQM